MSQEIIGGKIELDAKGANETIGSFRKQLREATQDLIAMNEKWGTGSEQATAAAKKVAEFRDRMADAKSLADAFNPDRKFAAFSQSIQGVVGGFAGLQGAMGLMGIKSKEVEEQLLKVQSAMALSQGLNTVLDSVQSFKNLGAVLSQITIIQKANAVANNLAAATMRLFGVATTQTGTAFNVLKGAIIATGIGALVVALGIAISYLSDFANAADEAADAQKKLNDSILEGANAQKDGELDFINRREKLDLAKANAEKKSAAEIAKIQELAQRERLGTLTRYHAEAGELDAKSNKELKDAQTEYEVKRLETQSKARDEADRRAKEYAAKAKADSAKRDAERKEALKAALEAETQTIEEGNKLKLSEEEKAQYDLTIKFAERIKAYERVGKETTKLVEAYEAQSNEIFTKYREDEAKKREEEHEKKLRDMEAESNKEKDILTSGLQQRVAWMEEEKMGYDARYAALQEFNAKVLADEKLSEEQRTELLRTLAETRKKIHNEEQESRKKALQGSAQALDSFAELAGEQTATGKALAIASTVIQTYLSAQEAFTAMAGIPYVGPALGAVAAAAAIAAGIARVKKITEIKVPGNGGSGSGGAASIPAPSLSTTTIGSAPVTPSTASGGTGMNDMLGNMKKTQEDTNSTLNKLNNTLSNGIQANIMEGEVAGVMGRTNSIQQQAQIGGE